jgi:hypothetical protein
LPSSVEHPLLLPCGSNNVGFLQAKNGLGREKVYSNLLGPRRLGCPVIHPSAIDTNQPYCDFTARVKVGFAHVCMWQKHRYSYSPSGFGSLRTPGQEIIPPCMRPPGEISGAREEKRELDLKRAWLGGY